MSETTDDLLDRLVGEYSDALAAGRRPDRAAYLGRVEPQVRPGLERCLKTIEAGLATAPAGPLPLVPGARFGRYELRHELGRGGMALVWLAHDEELRRPVALKILRPGLALEQRHVDRFRREATAVAKLRHPNIVQIFDVGSERGYHYLAMEFVEGPSLATVLDAVETRRYSADELRHAAGLPHLAPRAQTYEQAVAALLAQVAGALQAAHEKGLVHRDVKPSNILLRGDGTAVVADFGLAKGESDPALSITGDPLGTPYYMSPEQAHLSSVDVDHRTDVYSLGVSLYEALSGKRPFEGNSVLEVFEAIRTRLAPSLTSVESRASKQASAVAKKAMAHDRDKRYASAAALQEDLVALAEGRGTRAAQELGGPLKSLWTEMRWMGSGQRYEYRSERTFLGLPLVHVYSGPRYPGEKLRVAKGWFASGEIAVGGIAFGGMSVGLFSFGGLAAGVFTAWGGCAAALGLAFGGLAVAAFAFGGVALAYLAFGGVALGYGAVGGFARGKYAMGGNADGEYVITEGREDLTPDEWFEGVLPFLEGGIF